ncbi:lisH domain-containing FOPNL [Brachionus plicatilis]|uniref:Centrosomal protein 20 n=1 Tax=Brachionus plicatilis TaxID=10195 RepID=A0A3M7RIX1_BRAPC|nr:lisH domain-containing FOPNL [Brachionus plicatilis]
MSSFNDLKNVLKDALDNKGVINNVKAKLRAEIFCVLEDNTLEKPMVSQENLLINELIREYMEFNRYQYSKSVFLKESNQPSVPLNREIMAAELHIRENNTIKQVPLIYSVLWNLLNKDPLKEDDEEINNT